MIGLIFIKGGFKIGVNFYWKTVQPWFLENAKNPNVDPAEDEENIIVHIGKKSAAGLYCHKCGCTNIRSGTQYVHQLPSDKILVLEEDYEKEKDENKKKELKRELDYYLLSECPCCGESFSSEGSRTSSFTWTLRKHRNLILDLIKENNHEKVIRDEYGKEYSALEFFSRVICDDCQIEFQSGIRFS